MSLLFDNAHTPLTHAAAVGRRVLHFDAEAGAFDKEGEILGWVEGHASVCWTDGTRSLVPPTEIAIPVVTERMLVAAEEALFSSWRRQADENKIAEQRKTARRHARIVLEAALERPLPAANAESTHGPGWPD